MILHPVCMRIYLHVFFSSCLLEREEEQFCNAGLEAGKHNFAVALSCYSTFHSNSGPFLHSPPAKPTHKQLCLTDHVQTNRVATGMRLMHFVVSYAIFFA